MGQRRTRQIGIRENHVHQNVGCSPYEGECERDGAGRKKADVETGPHTHQLSGHHCDCLLKAIIANEWVADGYSREDAPENVLKRTALPERNRKGKDTEVAVAPGKVLKEK